MFISCNQSDHYHSIKTIGSIELTTQALFTTENLALQGGEEVRLWWPPLHPERRGFAAVVIISLYKFKVDAINKHKLTW